MVSVNSTNVTVAENNAIPWQNGNFTSCDNATSNGTTITLGRTGLYSINFNGSITTVAAGTTELTLFINGVASNIGSIVGTAANTPTASGFNTLIRVCKVPTSLSVVSDTAITVDKAQLKAVHL